MTPQKGSQEHERNIQRLDRQRYPNHSRPVNRGRMDGQGRTINDRRRAFNGTQDHKGKVNDRQVAIKHIDFH